MPILPSSPDLQAHLYYRRRRPLRAIARSLQSPTRHWRAARGHRSRVADPLEQIDVGVLSLQLDQLRLVFSLPEE